jgi:putative DNA primase/helicase
MHTTVEVLDDFRSAMAESGLMPPDDINADGRLHRFSATGKRAAKKNGYYVLHLDNAPAGTFGDWSTGMQASWRFNKPMSKADAAKARKAVEEAKRARAREEAARHAKAAGNAQRIWSEALPPPPLTLHPYLKAKRVHAHRTRVSGGKLVIPVCDGDGNMRGLQFIDAEGGKKFLPGTAKRGCFYLIGNPQGGRVIGVAEGFATAAAVHEAVGIPMAVAFDAGNLVPVAREVLRTYGQIVAVFADDDRETEGNPGLTAATKAACAVRGVLVTPGPWPLGERGTDFNDLRNALGGIGDAAISIAFLHARSWKHLCE